MGITKELHLFAILATALFCGSVVIATLRVTAESSRRSIARVLGIFMFLTCLVYNGYYFTPSTFDPALSLPLQMCDVLAILSALVMFNPFRTGVTFLAVSGIVFPAQAILTPTGEHDPAHLRFWLYWLLHGGIVACTLFAIIAYKPALGFKSFRAVLAVDLAYMAITLGINILFGWNYAYIGDSLPNGDTIIQRLGPWPQRVPIIIGVGVLMQVVMALLIIVSRRLIARMKE